MFIKKKILKILFNSRRRVIFYCRSLVVCWFLSVIIKNDVFLMFVSFYFFGIFSVLGRLY